MDSSGFCSPRNNAFPAGLRVLVVDDDATWLKILEKMLKKCSYEVTTCSLAREALDLLRERKDGFDIVISDVNMPDMDGFKLLERVGLELDLPVIMMSVDGETSRVMKGVQHGACDYLLKPIRMKELKNIWQHVLRKRIHEGKETDGDGLEELHMMSQPEYCNDYYSFSIGDMYSGKKRRIDAGSKHDDREYSDTSCIKKPRVVWTVDLHQKFVKAVNQTGFDKVGPKKILDLMAVPGLTRENVASHLQKYRLYLSRLQKDSALKDTSFAGVKRADVPPRDPAENMFLQRPIVVPQNDERNGNCGTSRNESPVHNVNVKIHDAGIKEVALGPVAEQMKALTGDDSDSKKRNSQCLSSSYSFRLPSTDITLADYVPSQYLWTTEYPQIQCKPESISHMHLDNKFDHLSPKVKIQQNEQVNTMPASSYYSIGPANRKEDNLADREFQRIRELPQAESEVNLFTIQSESQLSSTQQFGQTPSPTWTIRNGSSFAGPILLEDLEFAHRNIRLSSGSALSSEDKESLNNVLQGVHQPINVGIHNGESFDCFDPSIFGAVTPLYESLKFDYEFQFDSMEYPVLDQSLFIV
ncbi:hypothetical protein Leryth_018678 [Lithospermum erythrorhizon]|nr:hypothetical protein Leryth_018678 [Lithospermum erythrorhizon]